MSNSSLVREFFRLSAQRALFHSLSCQNLHTTQIIYPEWKNLNHMKCLNNFFQEDGLV